MLEEKEKATNRGSRFALDPKHRELVEQIEKRENELRRLITVHEEDLQVSYSRGLKMAEVVSENSFTSDSSSDFDSERKVKECFINNGSEREL